MDEGNHGMMNRTDIWINNEQGDTKTEQGTRLRHEARGRARHRAKQRYKEAL